MAKDTKQYLIFGVGRFGSALARKLSEDGHEVLAVDSDENRVRSIAPYVMQALQMEASDEEGVRSLGVRNFDAVVVSIGDNLKNSILMTLTCKDLGARYLVAKAADEAHARVLEKIGADRVVFPERDAGIRLAKTISSPNVRELMSLSGGFTLEDVRAPEAWVGHTLKQLDIRRRYNVSILLISRNGEAPITPNADTLINRGDELLVLGMQDDVNNVERLVQA
ncbi:MAG TPA: TrkA family potassium uptake protein [Clostridiales bacterium]|nr:TrkA family potassium uptake protein [Clostridiales bacterium]